MNVKEMSATYESNPTVECQIKLLYELVMETKKIAEIRHITTDSALVAIIREVDDKWHAFCRRHPEVLPTAFKVALHKLVPTAKEIYP